MLSPQVAFVPRNVTIAGLIQACAEKRITFSEACERIAKMGYKTTSVYEMVRALRDENQRLMANPAPVGLWRVHDCADGWIYYDTEKEARASKEAQNGALVEPVTPEGDRLMPYGSLGAERVRESFNPSHDSTVDKIKRYTADLIDLCEHDLKHLDPRLAALAQTAYEEAAMWAVKAATTERKP